jgi:hypothetical protein
MIFYGRDDELCLNNASYKWRCTSTPPAEFPRTHRRAHSGFSARAELRDEFLNISGDQRRIGRD